MATCRRSVASALLCAATLSGARFPAPTAQAPVPVTVPIRVINNHVYVRMVGGKENRELWFLLDTGAGISMMHLPTADSLGFPLGNPVQVGGAGPAVRRGARLSGVRVRLAGDSTLSVAPQIAMPLVALNAFEGIPVSGILGHDFIAQRVLEIDYARERLTLHDAKSFRYSGPGSRVPLRMRDNYPHVNAELVLADGGTVAADLAIDAGASGALALTRPLVERNRLLQRSGTTIYRQAGRGAGGATSAHIGRLARLRLGSVELVSPIAAMYGDSAGVFSTDGLFDGVIGGDVLRRFTVFLDYSRQEAILQPNASRDEPFEADMSGASFQIDSGHAGVRVVDVMPNGPAAHAGLRPNDLITAIDGVPALEYGIERLRRRMQRNGGEVAVVIRREGKEQTIRLPVRRLI